MDVSSLALWGMGLVAGLAVLVTAADVFLDRGERIGLHFGLSRFVVGVTIIAFGTSLPELLASVASVFMGDTGIAAGTVVGSNVTNILLILGITAILGGGIRVQTELIRVDLPFLFGSSLVLLLFAFDGRVGAIEGLLSLAALAVYISYAVHAQEAPGTTMGLLAEEVPAGRGAVSAGTWAVLAASAVGLQAGAWLAVESASNLSEVVGIGREILAASVVAVGTSLPELTVSVRAAGHGNPEVAVGNVIGSNIFNALGVIGVASLFGVLAVPESMIALGLPAVLGATLLCFFVVQDREMTRWDGWLLLILFVGFELELYGAF